MICCVCTGTDIAQVAYFAILVFLNASLVLVPAVNAAPNNGASAPELRPGLNRSPSTRTAVIPVPDASAEPAREGHETERQTVEKCLQDMLSQDVALRRRAVMILGKYRNVSAQQAVVRALGDADSEVRRSALVSISENTIFPPGADLAVVRLIMDPDIHIRRIASSMARDVLQSRRLAPFVRSGTQVARPVTESAVPGEIMAILNRALGDPDPTIRKNILSLASYMSGNLSSEAIQQCFSSEDSQVRYLALKAYLSAPGASGDSRAVEDVAQLADDPAPVVRRQLAAVLSRLGADGIVLLRKLAADPDPATRLEAVKGIVRAQDPDGFALLVAAIKDESLPLDDRCALGTYLLFYQDQAIPLLKELVSEGRPPLQTEAVRLLANSRFKDVDLAIFLRVLETGGGAVRSVAMSVLRRRSAELSLDQVRGFMRSEHPDVRELGLRLSPRLPGKEGEDLLFDGCLDDDTGVRCTALRELGHRHVDGAVDVLIASLEDEDADVRTAAAEGLLAFPSPSGQTALETFLPRCTDARLKRRIQQSLLQGWSKRTVPPRQRIPRTPRAPVPRP